MHAGQQTWLISLVHEGYDGPNEDAGAIDVARRAAAVFDGLAGHGDGAEAAQIACQAVTERFAALDTQRDGWASQTLALARERLRAARRVPGANPDMSSTAVIAAEVGDMMEIAWCGDSRAYRVSATGSLQRLSYDHDLIYDAEMRGRVSSHRADAVRKALEDVQTPSDAWRAGGALAKKAFAQSHIMVSELGYGVLDSMRVPWAEDDTLLLCTDGVHGNLTGSQLHAVVASLAADPSQLATGVAYAARERARTGEGTAHPDDITCVVLGPRHRRD